MLKGSAAATALAVLLLARGVEAGRPMITDDAGTVGADALQIETWLRLDEHTLEHWAVAGWGPLSALELSLGVVHGAALDEDSYSAAGPIAQAKLLVREPELNGVPGLALAAGTLAPWGTGGLEHGVWSVYGYGAITAALIEEGLLDVHANGGVVRIDLGADGVFAPTWGAGAQLAAADPVFVFAELVSGDPATEEQDGVVHTGIKYEFVPTAHVDATVGAGVWGDPRVSPFATLGLRWATE